MSDNVSERRRSRYTLIAFAIVGFAMGSICGAALHALYTRSTEVVITNESGKPIELVYVEDVRTKGTQVIRDLRPTESRSVWLQLKQDGEFSVEAVFADGWRAYGQSYVEPGWGMRARIACGTISFENK